MTRPPKNPVRFTDSEYYPLPRDYYELDTRGKRMARINAVSLRETPEDNVVAWDFFRRYYLWPMPDGLWYQHPLYDSPPAHYAYVHDIHKYPRVIQVFPRNFAKTILMLENVLRWLYIRPYWQMLLVKASDSFVRSDFLKLTGLMEHNARLRDDWGNPKGHRGATVWSQSRIVLENGSSVEGRSVISHLLGFRPNVWFVDDAEFDEVMQQTSSDLTEHLQRLLFNHLDPMLNEGCTGVLQGTLHGRKTLLYHAATVTEVEEPRWGYYHRVIWPAKTPTGELIWSQKFTEERLAEKLESLGAAAYASQMMNDPGSEEDRVFHIHPLFSHYTIENGDSLLSHKPLVSKADLVSWIPRGFSEGEPGDPVVVTRPLGETVSRMYRVAMVDYARGLSKLSDYSCIMVVGRENSSTYRDTLWVLDLFLGRVTESELIDLIWDMALKWRVRIVGIESVMMQQLFTDKVSGDFMQRAEREQWAPKVYPVKYQGEVKKSKAGRISGLIWRFEQFRVKLPRHVRSEWPWVELFEQIHNFTSDLKLLAHDDAIDTLAMYQYMLKSRGNYRERDEDGDTGPLADLRRGLTYIPGTAFKIVDTLPLKDIPEDVIWDMIFNEWKQSRKRTTTVVGPHRSLGGRSRGDRRWTSRRG